MVAGADRTFGEIRLSTADWPIVLLDFPEKRFPDDELHGVLDALEAVAREARKNREKLFFIIDVSRMREIAPASQRSFAGEWSKTQAALMRSISLGSAMVTPSALLRGMITAVFWFQPPPTPAVTMQTRHDAMLKGIAMLEEARIPLSPSLLAYRDAPHGRKSASRRG